MSYQAIISLDVHARLLSAAIVIATSNRVRQIGSGERTCIKNCPASCHLASSEACTIMSKVVFFYLDGSSHGESLRVAIHPDRFSDLEALMEFLGPRFAELPYGVRTIYSVHNNALLRSIDQLANQGHYIASDRRSKPRGVHIPPKSSHSPPCWRSDRPPSGKRLLSYSLRPQLESASKTGKIRETSKEGRSPSKRRTAREEKVIYVHRNGDAFHKHRFTVDHQRSLSHLLNEISFQLQFPVHQLYTIDGRKVSFV